MIKNFMGNFHGQIPTPCRVAKLMGRPNFNEQIYNHSGQKWYGEIDSEWQKYEQSPIPSAIAKDMGRFAFHAQLQNLWAISHFQIITGSIIQTT